MASALSAAPPSIQHQQKTITVDSMSSLTMMDPQSGIPIQWEQSQPVQIFYKLTRKWRPAVIVGITEHARGHYLDVHFWRSSRSAQVTAECLDVASECVRPISSPFEYRADWTSGSEVECFSESRQRWYLATVVRVIREEEDTEDWLELQWLIEHSPNDKQVYGKELQRSSDFIRHRYPHYNNLCQPLNANLSECTVFREDTRYGMSLWEKEDCDELSDLDMEPSGRVLGLNAVNISNDQKSESD